MRRSNFKVLSVLFFNRPTSAKGTERPLVPPGSAPKKPPLTTVRMQ